ncbi:hypothetical protein ARMSODRAFT_671857 [Armillaria solidipes]|uniref:Uncharacterized protein n=1 Tax=Armillaria solidipes TaxID=1076256 RepID=A0A2H3B9D3_9AGAR|nr:hypothetical protein ARMSODRAFT_671857 [Armillaria solidipes]
MHTNEFCFLFKFRRTRSSAIGAPSGESGYLFNNTKQRDRYSVLLGFYSALLILEMISKLRYRY